MNQVFLTIVSFAISLLPLQISNANFSDKISLEFLGNDDFQIKIDGGCSFYTYDTTSLTKDSYIIVINGEKLAFSKINGKLVYFKHVKRTLNTGGYIDTFIGKDHKVILDVKLTSSKEYKETIFSGILKMTHMNSVTIIPVHGINNEHVFALK